MSDAAFKGSLERREKSNPQEKLTFEAVSNNPELKKEFEAYLKERGMRLSKDTFNKIAGQDGVLNSTDIVQKANVKETRGIVEAFTQILSNNTRLFIDLNGSASAVEARLSRLPKSVVKAFKMLFCDNENATTQEFISAVVKTQEGTVTRPDGKKVNLADDLVLGIRTLTAKLQEKGYSFGASFSMSFGGISFQFNIPTAEEFKKLEEKFGFDWEDGDGNFNPNFDGSSYTKAQPFSGIGKTAVGKSIQRIAERLGISALDLATVIAYETAGTFDKWVKGPTTKWGVHRGLIQWGEPQRRQYGVTQSMSFDEQMEKVGQYLYDRGVRPGMGILSLYKAINGGSVRVSDGASDGYGTQVQHVARMMGGHRQLASSLFTTNSNTYAAL